MADEEWSKLEDKAAVSIGALLAKMRWSKATPAERKAVGRKLAQARKAKRGRK